MHCHRGVRRIILASVKAVLSQFSLLLYAGIAALHAHELRVPVVPAEDVARIQPPLYGSENFARTLTQQWQGLVPEAGMVSMQRINEALGWLDAANQGAAGAPGLRETAWLRWRVSEESKTLAASLANLQTIDFRKNATPESSVIEIDPQLGALAIQVILGEGPEEFATHTVNFTGERDPLPYTVAVGGGTTHVLLKLDEIPAGETTTQRIIFQPREPGAPAHWWTLHFKTKPSGNLRVDITDESGTAVPAMVRLTAKETRRLWEPAGAVDLRPMMNEITSLPIYGPGRGYMLYIPEPWRGHYWVMPGPLDMALPAGEWELHVWRGLEYAPVKLDLSVKPGELTRQTVKLHRWIDMAAQGWFAGDDHVHARIMSGEDADKLMAWTRAADIGVCNVLEMGDEMRTWYAQRGFGPDFRIQHGNHWIVPGQEDPRGILGHAIGLNLTAKVRDRDRYLDQRWVAEEIHRQGGLYGHTHVGAKALFVERQMALYTADGLVDFNSILQATLNTELITHYLNLGYKMTASAGTDTPYGGTVGCVRMYAHTGNKGALDPDAWFQAVKNGHTFVTTGPMVDFRVGDAIPGDEIELKDDAPLTARITARGLAGKSAPQTVRLVRFGEVLKEVKGKPGQETLELEFEVEPGHGCWLAAHVIGEDGSEAWTTPVYLRRPGFRWWAVERIPELLAVQESVLKDIEQVVTEAKAQAAARPMDYTLKSVVQCADILLGEVARARAHNTELAAIHQREMKARKP
jgi:hypothetical protein